jgi:endogenous inhibitor of DNA gyrase (YacG/DUF329 family)
MTIYRDRIPYTYLIGWSNLNIWYYGRRTKKGCHPSEFWKKYFTSSIEVKKFRIKHGEPDVVQIRKTFEGVDSVSRCSMHEEKVIRKIKAVGSPNWLNKGNAGAKFNTTGKVIGKDKSSGKTKVVDVIHFNSETSIVGINSGKTFNKKPCCHCGKEVPINNVKQHQLYCSKNINRIDNPLKGYIHGDLAKKRMSDSKKVRDINGVKNPNAKFYKLTSPAGEQYVIQGNLDSTLRDMNLSRFNLLNNIGKVVPKPKYNTTELSRRTVGWKLEKI